MACCRLPAAGLLLALGAFSAPAPAEDDAGAPAPLLPEATVRALGGELSGENARRTVQALTLHHRMRGSRGFDRAAAWIHERAAAAGLEEVETLELPADGEIFYGTQRSRPAWDAEHAELWELAAEGGGWRRARRIASWEERPVTLAQDSASGAVVADLVDVGEGTAEEDYAGRDVTGKLVLVAAQPSAVRALAVDRLGAAGIVSYAQNQRTAWWKEDESLVRWGHLGTFPPPETFAFMVSLGQARAWRERLAADGRVRLEARVEAGQHPGAYRIVTARLAGSDPALRGEEIVFSCHLDHLRPGANDNASGCATILEVGRALATLVREGTLRRPARSLRFVFPAEIEGTMALLEGRPDLARRFRAVLHLDMVGGGPETRAVFHVTRSPASLPTFVNDVAEAFGRFVNAESDAFAAAEGGWLPLVAPEGGKRPLQAVTADFSPGSDHQVYTEGSYRIPAIYLNDWPDRYIHTHADTVANIDPTKLLRAGFIAAASGWFLADFDTADVAPTAGVVRRHALERLARVDQRRRRLLGEEGVDGEREAANLVRFHLRWEADLMASIGRFAAVPPELEARHAALLAALGQALELPSAPLPAEPDATPVYRRASEAPRGPLSVFGYDHLRASLEALESPLPELLGRHGLWGSDYAYEALNLVDGSRSAAAIRDDLAAIYGPLPLEPVLDYLGALERVGILVAVPAGAAPASGDLAQ